MTRQAKPHTRALGLAAACALTLQTTAIHAVVLNDFNNYVFDFTFDDFVQTPSATSLRITDVNDGWGGGGSEITPLDFSGLTDQYVQVDYTVLPNHGANQFSIELYDNAGRSVKYAVPTPTNNAGQPRTYTTRTPLGQPRDGVGDFLNFDYANVTRFGMIGDFANPNPFDLALDEVRLTPIAPPPYGGAESNAAWRALADQRIDQLRKADLQIDLTTPDGQPIDDALIRVTQQSHQFKFGSAVVGNKLAGNPSASDTAYRQKVLELFNTVTLENTLKWPALEGEFGNNFSETIALQALDWAADNDLDARGHVLVWPGLDNLPQSIRALENDPVALRQAVLDHVVEFAAKTQDKLIDWDVVNEPRTNNDLLTQFGDAIMDEWFAAADANNDARLFINEFNIITGNENYQANRALYLETIQGLQQRNAPIDAIGMQGHFRPNDLTDIERVWDILDQFHDATGLPIAITEYDFETTDRQLQADYLRDFMTAVFAHEAVDEFIQWGFWENAHWRPDAALFDADWTIRPAGETYLDLIFNQWWSQALIQTDQDGLAESRVFKGDYLVEIEVDGQFRTYNVTVGDDGLILTDTFGDAANALLGDFNGNGSVEQADLDLVLANWGAATTPASFVANTTGLADGIDQEELDAVLGNWGSTTAPNFRGLSVPEPAAATLLLLLPATARRRARVRQKD